MVDIYNYLTELTSLEIIYKDETGLPMRLYSHIKSVDPDMILVSPPQVHTQAANLPDGAKIKLIITTQDGVFSGVSSVIKKELSQTAGLWISFPYNVQHCQRREYLRVPIHIDFDLVITKDNNTQEKEVRTYKTKNLSGKGVNFVSDDSLGEYYDLTCRFKLEENDSEYIETTCEHIYSKKTKIARREKYIHALAFSSISESNIDKIVKFCFKYQLNQRRNEKFINVQD